MDDNRDAAATLSMLLQQWGHDVSVAADGPSALKLAARIQPQVALLDIGLPGMDGYELARRMRRASPLKDTSLIAISGYGREEDRRLAKEAGFDEHLVKPADPKFLRTLLARLRSKQQAAG